MSTHDPALEPPDPAPGGGPIEPGLFRERTELAWNRSGLALAVTIAVVLRRLWPLSGDKQLAALALIAVGATTWVIGLRIGRHRQTGRFAQPRGVSTFRAMTVGTLLLAAAGVIVAVFYPA